MSRVLFLESVSGVAGDMFAAAFVDAGLVTAAEIADVPRRLGLAGVRVELTPVIRATMRATHLKVIAPEATAAAADPAETETHLVFDPAAHHQHYRHADIDRQIAAADLPEGVRRRARAVFRLIAEAEAAAHGMAVDTVAFHEVGAADSIVDVVLAAWCIEKVNPDRVCATPIRPGRGFVRMAHGRHPVPPPASARLLAGLPVAPTPEGITREHIELSTPTGIAILKALAPEWVSELPPGIVRQQGMGAGTLDLGEVPNVFRVAVVDSVASCPAGSQAGSATAPVAPATSAPVAPPALPYETDRVVEVAANLDDDTGEHLAWLAEQLLAQGALDAWMTPAVGKKGRPLTCFQFLASEGDFARLADWFLRHSTSFGLRHRTWDRLKLARHFETRVTPAGPLTYKIGLTTDGTVLKEKPEFDEQRRHWERTQP
jgi:uncharacterized protein (TIGR00299 family) protein